MAMLTGASKPTRPGGSLLATTSGILGMRGIPLRSEARNAATAMMALSLIGWLALAGSAAAAENAENRPQPGHPGGMTMPQMQMPQMKPSTPGAVTKPQMVQPNASGPQHPMMESEKAPSQKKPIMESVKQPSGTRRPLHEETGERHQQGDKNPVMESEKEPSNKNPIPMTVQEPSTDKPTAESKREPSNKNPIPMTEQAPLQKNPTTEQAAPANSTPINPVVPGKPIMESVKGPGHHLPAVRPMHFFTFQLNPAVTKVSPQVVFPGPPQESTDPSQGNLQQQIKQQQQQDAALGAQEQQVLKAQQQEYNQAVAAYCAPYLASLNGSSPSQATFNDGGGPPAYNGTPIAQACADYSGICMSANGAPPPDKQYYCALIATDFQNVMSTAQWAQGVEQSAQAFCAANSNSTNTEIAGECALLSTCLNSNDRFYQTTACQQAVVGLPMVQYDVTVNNYLVQYCAGNPSDPDCVAAQQWCAQHPDRTECSTAPSMVEAANSYYVAQAAAQQPANDQALASCLQAVKAGSSVSSTCLDAASFCQNTVSSLCLPGTANLGDAAYCEETDSGDPSCTGPPSTKDFVNELAPFQAPF